MVVEKSNFQDLIVWQKSIDLAELIYSITSEFPSEEKYGLISQIRRSTVSISSNIAEGAARNSPREFLQFISIARGSIAELKTQIYIAKRVKFITEVQLNEIILPIEDISKMLVGLKNSIQKTVNSKLKTVN